MSNEKTTILVGVAAVLLVLGFGFYEQWSAPWPASPPVQYVRVPVPSVIPVHSPTVHSLPVRLKIPKIQVDANVKALGVTAAGVMDVPSDTQEVGWYKYGPHPGEAGSAVIAGHFGTLKGKRSVFNDLIKLGKGDTLSVTDDTGHVTSYVVQETRTYHEADSARDVFDGARDGSHLNLITCTGPWNKTQKRFAERLVVFANKV